MDREDLPRLEEQLVSHLNRDYIIGKKVIHFTTSTIKKHILPYAASDLPQCTRVSFKYGEHYLAKVRGALGFDSLLKQFFFQPVRVERSGSDLTSFEEESVCSILKSELSNGDFHILDHVATGIIVKNNAVVIDKSAGNCVITSDESCGGYIVRELEPYDLLHSQLDNAEELRVSYQKHLNAFVSFLRGSYHDYNISIMRNARPSQNELHAMLKMILLKKKDKRGELFIGDLDNLLIERRYD